MKAKAFLVLLVLAVALSGCVQQPEPDVIVKYVCSTGVTVDNVGECPPPVDCDYEANCPPYCEDSQSPEGELTANYVKAEIAKANYCELPEDCVLADTKCPLGCYNIVNVSELERINGLVHDFKQTCFQTCTTILDVNCLESKCVTVAYVTS